jgi:hypothetical protein
MSAQLSASDESRFAQRCMIDELQVAMSTGVTFGARRSAVEHSFEEVKLKCSPHFVCLIWKA